MIRKQSQRALWSFIQYLFILSVRRHRLTYLCWEMALWATRQKCCSGTPGVKLQKSKTQAFHHLKTGGCQHPLAWTAITTIKLAISLSFFVKSLEISGLKCLLQKFPYRGFGMTSFWSLLALMDPLSIVFRVILTVCPGNRS